MDKEAKPVDKVMLAVKPKIRPTCAPKPKWKVRPTCSVGGGKVGEGLPLKRKVPPTEGQKVKVRPTCAPRFQH